MSLKYMTTDELNKELRSTNEYISKLSIKFITKNQKEYIEKYIEQRNKNV